MASKPQIMANTLRRQFYTIRREGYVIRRENYIIKRENYIETGLKCNKGRRVKD